VEYVDISCRAEMRDLVRDRHRIPDEARVLFWIGRLDVMKRPLQTIEAFGKVGNPLVHLMMIGPDGSLTRQDCERFCAERNISNVHLIGPVYGDEKYQYYMASDAYISLSFRENFNYTAAEAMACGLPVILSSGNDLGHELRDINCGWMLKTSGEKECLDVLNQFVSMPQILLDEMGLSGLRWARNALSWETFAQSLRQLAAEATNNH
jgi:glycosyltransferase involved in cell wall biosynthesis